MPNGFQWLLVIGVFVAIVWGVWHSLAERSASQHWPATPGQVTVSRVVAGSDGSLDRSGQWFEVEIEYAYTVEGASFVGKRLHLAPRHYREEAEARAALQGFAAGAQVPVFYAPGNPATSVLLRN